MTDPGARLVVERHVAASPETIFSFFAEERWTSWQGVDAAIELAPGGLFRVNVVGDGYAAGRVVDVEPPRRLVFTWGWEEPGSPVAPGSSVVTIELIPDATGTLVRLTHASLPPEAEDSHRAGWTNYADRLAAVAEGRDPGPDPLRVA